MIPIPLLEQIFDNETLEIDMIDDDFWVVYKPIVKGKEYSFANLSYRDGFLQLGINLSPSISNQEEILEKFALKLTLEPYDPPKTI